MALNLSTLTSPANSSVLEEVNTTADFLESVPVFRNLSRGSNKGGDAKQDVALNQPKALPLAANGKGYCYLPVTTGNAPGVTFPAIGVNDNFVLEMVVYIVNVEDFHVVSGSNSHRILIYSPSGVPSFQYRDGSNNNNAALSGSLSAGLSTLRFEKTGSTLVFKQNGAVKGTLNNITAAPTFTHLSFNGQFSTSRLPLNGYIQTCTLSIGGTQQLNVDFTATNVRHGDTKFKCATGQVVTINQSGNDPATIIKKPVLRFDGSDDFMKGVFGQTINGGYMFMAFSVLGDGGNSSGRVFTVSSNGVTDTASSGALFSYRGGVTSDLQSYFAGAIRNTQSGMFDDSNGDILHEALIKNGSQKGGVNNANFLNTTLSTTIDAEEFNISCNPTDTEARNTAIDLEYLALFPASITDAQADDVRNYINNRNNVFDLKDGFGYYFFDPQIFPIAYPAAFVSFWGGNIVGSDNTLNASVSQSVVNHRPTRDGYKVTFNDNGDHLVVASPLSGGQAGWQIVGTSLGTFAYRVNANAVTELNLLGNLGNASYRKTGDLYGIILLPESATGADIEAARKLLIDRGAADGVTGTSLSQYFRERADIVDFHNVDTSNISSLTSSWSNCSSLTFFPLLDFSSGTNFYQTWFNCSSLKSFPLIDASSGTNFYRAWRSCISLNDFAAIDARNGTSFQEAWQNCSSLTSFPAGAKLGTEANNVNFTSAWQQSGLTSFSTPLPTATSVNQAWHQCALLTSFSSDLSAVTTANYAWLSCTSLTSFDTPLPSATQMLLAWYNCSSLTSFSSELPSAVNVNQAWLNCTSLTDFSADVFANWNPSSITTGVFNLAWDGCVALTAQSVENILTSIDTSGQYATSTGASGGSALADAGIDIDYNTATGSLSAATNTAVTSLKSKGWSIIVNNVTL
jgi:hypothetical protein